MVRKYIHDLIRRWGGNPILTAQDMPFPCTALHNAGAVMFEGRPILMLRVEDMRGMSFFILARSKNGFQFSVDEEPAMVPSTKEPFASNETLGIQDARITKIEDRYYITYTARAAHGSRLALARTEDFKTFERICLATQPENRSGTLLPRKIQGRFALLQRPLVGDTGHLWISFSNDLIYWGDARVVMTTRGGFWDCNRIGVACPPIETEKGWLLIYYGEKFNASGHIYRLGTALLDLEDPCRVIGRSDIPILSPREYYERVGDVDNMVFATGAVVNEKLGNLMVYYGAATNSICLGWAKLDLLIKRCLNHD
ncbi:MAG: glycoside hydrolase family 130 protein [Planctomycetes bacterium]|nr:glycoside hydrolase family 130 protein [Planctomycetota bacterium]